MADFNDCVFVDEDEDVVVLSLPDDTTAFRDVIPPVVVPSPVTPGPVMKDDAIVFTVTDVSNAFRRIIIMAAWLEEFDVVWAGDVFAPKYNVSVRSVILNGYQFSIKRNLGWPFPLPEGQKLVIRVLPFDIAGNESV